MTEHLLETADGAIVITSNEDSPEGVMTLRLHHGHSVQVRLTDAERVRLIGQLAAFAPWPGIVASRLQEGDELRDSGEVVYTLERRLPDDMVDGVPMVRWGVRYRDGGVGIRGWNIDTTTPLRRPA
jgi:hypothetical protein